MSGTRRSIVLDGKVTSIQLEGAFWDYLDRLADECDLTWAEFVRRFLARNPPTDNRASAIKQALLQHAVGMGSGSLGSDRDKKTQYWQLSWGGSTVTVQTSWKLLRLGRQTDCDLVLRDPECSKLHAAVFPIEGRWWIADLASKNGLWQNGERIMSTALRSGRAVRAGKTEIRLLNS